VKADMPAFLLSTFRSALAVVVVALGRTRRVPVQNDTDNDSNNTQRSISIQSFMELIRSMVNTQSICRANRVVQNEKVDGSHIVLFVFHSRKILPRRAFAGLALTQPQATARSMLEAGTEIRR